MNQNETSYSIFDHWELFHTIFRTMSVEKDTNCDYGVIFALKCDAGHSGSWKCDVVVEVRQYKTNDLDYGVMMVMTRQVCTLSGFV